MLRIYLISLFVGLLSVTADTAEARTLNEIRAAGELRICTAGSSAAFYQTNAEAFAIFLGVRPNVVRLADWDQQFHNKSGVTVKEAHYEARSLADGSCDLFPNDLHMENWRKTKMLLVPYYKTRKMIVTHLGMRQVFKQESDLAGHTAAVQKGTAYESWIRAQNEGPFKNQPVPIELAPTDSSMKLVAQRQVDFTVIGAEGAFKWVRGDLGNLDLLFPVDDIVQVGWGISPTATDLARSLETFFQDSFRVGSDLDRSWQRQYGISLMEYHLFESSIDSIEAKRGSLLAWAVPVLMGLCGLLLAVLFWARRLNKEIDTRRKTEIALRESKERLEAAASAGIVGVWDWDVVNNRLAWDKVMYQLYGIREEDFAGAYEAWASTVHPDDRVQAEEEIQAALRGEHEYEPEFRVLWPDGSTHYIKAASKTLFDPRGQPQRMIGVNYDLTKQKNIEHALARAKIDAEVANQAKSRFLAMMSHEIRTPMNGAIGMAQLLLRPELSDNERLNYARIILNSGQTLLTLLNDILDLSKIEAGRIELENLVVEPDQTIQEIVTLFAEQASAKGLRLDAIWAGAKLTRYRSDPIRLRQMLSNLVGNAIKFTEQGHIRIECREIEQMPNATLLEFSVMDSGIGIPPDKQNRLFKPFSQVDAETTRKFGGTGLGLSIVRNLAILMGGDVGVESEDGKGARLWFRIQAGLVKEGEESRGDERSLMTQPIPMSRQAQASDYVLIAEDNPINRQVIDALLRTQGIRFEIVENGKDALDRVISGATPVMVLMDCQMPMMDGYEATMKIRQWEAAEGKTRLPIVALTASAFHEDREKCLAAGMDGFLTKPLNMNDLIATLAKWMDTR